MPEVSLNTEKIDLCKTIAMKIGRTVVDDTLIVPDIKPDIKKILDVSARSYITDITPGQDKIHVEGVVKATLIYLPEGDVIGNVKTLEMSHEFGHTIDAKGTTADNLVTAESEIGSVDTTLINSRKVNVRVSVDIGVKISKNEPIYLPIGIEDLVSAKAAELPITDLLPFTPRKSEPTENNSQDPNIELKRVPIKLASKQFLYDSSMILREQHEISSKLPAIGEILVTNLNIEPEDVVTSDGMTRVSGNIKATVLYEDAAGVTEDSPKPQIRTAEFSIQFQEQFDTPDALDDMECDAEYTIKDIYTEILDNIDGEPRIIGVEAVVQVGLCGYIITEPEVITDAYSLDGSGLELEFSDTSPEQLVDHQTAQISHKCTANLKPTDPEIVGVCDVIIEKTSIDDMKITDNKIYIKGTITAKILCSSNDENQPIFALTCASEFEHEFECDEDLSGKVACDTKIFVNHISYTISGANAVDLRYLIGLSIKLIKTDRIKAISSIDRIECELSPQNGLECYIIYFVQPGDTLWRIAKRYHTTVDEILKHNNIPDRDKINIGQKIKVRTLG